MENKDETFRYTYSAKEQAEVAHIRDKYLPQKEDKMAQLRALDQSVSRKAAGWGIGLGVLGSLIMGTGMSLTMSELSLILGAYQKYAMVIGVAIGLLGIALVALAYPVYHRVLAKERARVAPQILRLTDELMQ